MPMLPPPGLTQPPAATAASSPNGPQDRSDGSEEALIQALEADVFRFLRTQADGGCARFTARVGVSPPGLLPALGTDWPLAETYQPRAIRRVATKDFRVGYRFVWDLEVPMRHCTRPFQLRPGVRRAPPPELPLEVRLPSGSKVTASSPTTPDGKVAKPPETPEPSGDDASIQAARPEETPPATSSAGKVPKGARMAGWSKFNRWREGDG